MLDRETVICPQRNTGIHNQIYCRHAGPVAVAFLVDNDFYIHAPLMRGNKRFHYVRIGEGIGHHPDTLLRGTDGVQHQKSASPFRRKTHLNIRSRRYPRVGGEGQRGVPWSFLQ